MQIVAYGQQDVYITGNPDITFFQLVYKRHTNFAMENIQQTYSGTLGNLNQITVLIAKNGDLAGEMYVELQPIEGLKNFSNVNHYSTEWLAERAIASVELNIGGQLVDKHYQKWWRLYSELYLPADKKRLWAKMTSYPIDTTSADDTRKVFLPLLFFFNRNPGLYLPIMALSQSEVKLIFNLSGKFANYFTLTRFTLWCNFVFIDTEERKRLMVKGRDYLIEQVQHQGAISVTQGATQYKTLNYVNPVKELIWCFEPSNRTVGESVYWNTTYPAYQCTITSNPMSNTAVGVTSTDVQSTGGTLSLAIRDMSAVATRAHSGYWLEEPASNLFNTYSVGPMKEFLLQFNSVDRFKEQSGKYFNQIQPYQYHSGCPYPGIYSYSFALKPEEYQPSGACNFSRFDSIQAKVTMKSMSDADKLDLMYMFAVSYNVFSVKNGMGGLLFSG